MERILLLEDDKSLVTGLTLALGRAGYALDTARTLAEAGHLWQAGRYDLLMLDVTLPDGTGFDFCREVRRTSGVPILFLTASDEEMDIITGLDLGGDDYITKPFLAQELLLRLGAVLRRIYRPPAPPEADRLGETELCWGAGVLRRAGREIPLTAKEFTLLKTLWANRGNIVTIDALCAALWTGPLVGYENTLMVHIRRLREKLEADPSHPKYLKTVRGLGYRLVREERP